MPLLVINKRAHFFYAKIIVESVNPCRTFIFFVTNFYNGDFGYES